MGDSDRSNSPTMCSASLISDTTLFVVLETVDKHVKVEGFPTVHVGNDTM